MEQILDCVMELGEQLLVNGAAVHRVEDSVERLLCAYGAVRTDVFIITSSMVVTVHNADGRVITQTRRINESRNDFEKVHQLNALSRQVCAHPMPAEQLHEQIRRIATGKSYPLWLEFVCFSVIAGAFTLFFGGGVVDCAVSLIIGVLVRTVLLGCDALTKNKILGKFVASLCSTALAYAALKWGMIGRPDAVLIGNIMTLIPGIGLTNALKDLLVGDSIAGLLRTIEAILLALSIAAGYFVVTLLFGEGLL